MSLTLAHVFLLCVFALLLATGQVLFKVGADRVPTLRSLGDLPSLASSLSLWAAFLLYIGASLLWIYLLQRVPLSRAYAFASLAFILVPLFAWQVFGESLGPRYLVGAACIMVGVYLTGTATH